MSQTAAVRTIGRAAARAAAFVHDEVPLYYQLAGVLRENIVSGAFASGGRLPTEAELVEQYGVSRITVRQALRILEQEDLIRREVGRGTFVTEHGALKASVQVEGSLDDLISMVMATSVQIVDLRTIKASAQEASILDLEPGAPITRCTRLRLHHDEPYSRIINDVPRDIGRRLTRTDWKGSILRALEDKLGIAIRDAQQTVRASLADATLARLLKTRIGAPLLYVDRVVMTDGGRVVDRVRTHYRSDIYSLSVHLARDRTAKRWALKGRRD